MTQKDNILGTMPMGRLVVAMSWPIMVSMLIQAIYNLVDSIYIARVSDSAFLALSYAYPIQTLMVAFCVGTGVGFNATLSRRLGEKKQEEASQVVLHGFLLYFLCWLLFLAFGLFACAPYLRACTDNPAVAAQGADYLGICCSFALGICIQFPCERILQSTGHPGGFMIVQGSGALINLILDPILIFGFGMGVKGAAAATVIGQIIGGLIGFYLLWRIRRELPISLLTFRFQPALTGEMCRIAAPAVLMQSLSSLMSLGMNSILTLWSETAVWVLGVYFKLQSFVFMPVFSVNNAMISILSYNYGARNRQRVTQAIRFGMLAAVATALLGMGVVMLAASPLLLWCFRASADAWALGVPALRMTALSFPPAAISIIWSAAFQSLGHSRYSLAVSLLRNLLFLLPVAFILVQLWPEGTFLAFFFAELAACLVTAFLYRRVRQNTILRI